MPAPHVQVVLSGDTIPENLKSALRRSGATASFRPLAEVLRSGVTPSADAVVVVAPEDSRGVQSDLRVLLDRMADRPRATLVMKATGQSMPRLAHPASVPVTFGGDMGEDELSIRLSAMLEMRRSLDSLHRDARQAGRAEAASAQNFNSQLRLASKVQRELLPEPLPAFGPVSFAAIYRPADLVSGDIYDVQRLDEDHVGVAVADATGRGIPAALLTVFVKRALRGKEISDGRYRILRPDEVLARLNQEILDANLSECRYVAASYAVLNTRTGLATLARGGAPYPLLRRAAGEIEALRPEGGLVGVTPNARFTMQQVQLAPGDTLLFFTDGFERLVTPQLTTHAVAAAFRNAAAALNESRGVPAQNDDDARPRGPRLVSPEATEKHALSEAEAHVAAADLVHASAWVAALSADGVDVAFDQLLVRHDSLRRIGHALDDLTVVAVKFNS